MSDLLDELDDLYIFRARHMSYDHYLLNPTTDFPTPDCALCAVLEGWIGKNKATLIDWYNQDRIGEHKR